jgi:hypothetical protein
LSQSTLREAQHQRAYCADRKDVVYSGSPSHGLFDWPSVPGDGVATVIQDPDLEGRIFTCAEIAKENVDPRFALVPFLRECSFSTFIASSWLLPTPWSSPAEE